MLAGAGFGDDAALAHAPGQQRLAQAVVDLVRAGVQQIFALDVDLRAARGFGEAAGVVERRGAARVVGEQMVEFVLESGIGAALPRKSARVLRAGTSALRERSGRRRGRNGRPRRAERES